MHLSKERFYRLFSESCIEYMRKGHVFMKLDSFGDSFYEAMYCVISLVNNTPSLERVTETLRIMAKNEENKHSDDLPYTDEIRAFYAKYCVYACLAMHILEKGKKMSMWQIQQLINEPTMINKEENEETIER